MSAILYKLKDGKEVEVVVHANRVSHLLKTGCSSIKGELESKAKIERIESELAEAEKKDKAKSKKLAAAEKKAEKEALEAAEAQAELDKLEAEKES